MTRSPLRLPGTLSLVTGAGSGIGRATAIALARQGSRVLCADLDEEAAAATATTCASLGLTGDAYGVDVADRDAVLGLAKRVHDEHGPLDVLVNNAGVGMSGRFLDTALEDWDWILSINLVGVIHGCHAFGPAMVERGRGHVVNVSSGLGYTPRATEPAYVTTKAAVLALSRCLRADWEPHGVGVSAICPGVINTPIARNTRLVGASDSPARRSNIEKLFRKGHPPELVGEAIVAAIEKDKPVVPVGVEARVGWLLNGLVPSRLADKVARASVGGV